jgi:hypothetical protein
LFFAPGIFWRDFDNDASVGSSRERYDNEILTRASRLSMAEALADDGFELSASPGARA